MFLACIPPLTRERAIRETTITSNFTNLISSNKPCQSISWAEAGPQAAGAQVYNWFYCCLCGFAGVWLAGSQGGPISVYMDFCSDYVNDARMGERRSIEDTRILCAVQRLLILKESHYLEQLMGRIIHTCI